MGKAWLAAMALCMSAAPAWAAREFTPQAGLWMIPSENNGQPGRGFSLDVQGNTAFLQVFNYEKNGAATFHTAVGQLDDSAAMTVPLLRFKGGRSFGGPVQDAVSDGTAGDVTVKFADGLNGTVQFPGESEQPISRFLVNEKLPYWWAAPSNSPSVETPGSRSMKWVATGNDGTRYLWRASLLAKHDTSFVLSYGQVTETNLYPQRSQMNCQLEQDTQVFDCITSTTSDSVPPEPGILSIHRVRFRAVGPDIVGTIQPQSTPADRLTLNGNNLGSASFDCSEPCFYVNESSIQAYHADSFPGGDCIPEMCNYIYSLMVLPTSGAWTIEDESTGRPGRGIFLDVQDSTIIIQTSDYTSNGDPTFHMGSGSLKSENNDQPNTTATLDLLQYTGGRYFGGPAQSGSEVNNAGTLQLRISHVNDRKTTDFGTGDIHLPMEGLKRMRRLKLESSTNVMADKLGEYLIRWSTAKGRQAQWVRLTRLVDVFAMNDDGTVQCYWQSTAFLNKMRCALLPSASIFQDWIGSATVTVSPFHRNDEDSDYLIRTRDQHGNWIGLGVVNLPGLTIPQDQ